MIEFNLDIDEGEWFPYCASHIDSVTGEVVFDAPASDARVKVRPLGPLIEEQLTRRKRAVEHIYNPKTRSMDRVSYYPDLSPDDEKKQREDVWDHIIAEFENFKNVKTGELIPCTRENKIALMRIPAFDRFIGHCIQQIADSGARTAKESEKN